MATGRAAVFLGAGRPFEIREYDVPAPEPGAIVVRITAAGICGSDLHTWRGDAAMAQHAGGGGARAAGHESVGRVQALGAGVTTDSLGQPLREGDRICYPYFYPCQRCSVCLRGQMYACLRYRPGSRGVDDPPHFTGAFADYYYLYPRHFVFRVPDELPDEVVAPINCGYSAAMFSMELAGVDLGDTVVIQGAGGLGLFAAAVAREMGAGKVISIDGLESRLELARACGADYTININDYPHPADRVELVKKVTNGEGADLVAEFVGLAAAVTEGMDMMRVGGRYVLIGNITPGQTIPLEPAAIVMGRKTIIGSGRYNPLTIPKALAFLVRNKDRYPLASATLHTFALDEINRAFEQAEWQGRSGSPTDIVRAVIRP